MSNTNKTAAQRAEAYVNSLSDEARTRLMDAHRAKEVAAAEAERAAQPLYNLTGRDVRERLWPSKPKR